ncbi:YheC/D like ATP-grasp [Anaerobranca californiensis DSM 14826]|jgi:glutathione synthase/RimK-type ligase-like ATP-grasp enzyme|uniref:YheC/D like ATP-grasp n=2 Tax=Anaerobranca TaxID=42447 RepID=A0A1M6RTG2_9FIRM|nr:YheC/D like ATP-grasp [Anaerobranca californiensis DSM 14826]
MLLQKKTEGYSIANKTIDKPIEFSAIEEVVGHIKGFSKGYLVQEFIDNKRVGTNFFDIRIYVQKNLWGRWQVTGGISRIAVNKSFITNLVKKVVDFSEPLKGHYCPKLQVDIIDTLETISLQVANILDEKLGPLGELAVDYCIGLNDQPYIIEVNGKPMKTIAKRLQSPTLYNNLYLRPMEYAYYLAKKNNTP